MLVRVSHHLVLAFAVAASFLLTETSPAAAQECQSCDSGAAIYGDVARCTNGGCGAPQCRECGSSGLCENLSLFLGLEGSKQPQDFGVNAHFGGRFHANWGVPLSLDHGIGLQVGVALNETRNAVQVVERIEGSKSRTQLFATLGLFQRTESGFNWGLVYDYLEQEYFDDFSLGQWRGHVGYWCNECTEVGIRGAFSDRRANGNFLTQPVVLDPITQGALYGRRVWPTAAVTGIWLGIAEGHGEANIALGDLTPVGERFVFGADIFAPLTDRLAIYGEANFISPADTGTVDAYLGVSYHFGGARRAFRRRFAPVLPVANNTSMSVDLTR